MSKGKFVIQATIYDASDERKEPKEMIEGEEIGEFETLDEAVARLSHLMVEGER